MNQVTQNEVSSIIWHFEPTKTDFLDTNRMLDEFRIPTRHPAVCRVAGQAFYRCAPVELARNFEPCVLGGRGRERDRFLPIQERRIESKHRLLSNLAPDIRELSADANESESLPW